MANNNTEKIMIGAGAAALAAGIYFFQTKHGKRNAKKLKGWMVRMKGEVLEKLEEAEEVTEPVYRGIVDTVANAEIVASKIPRSEILALATDLKRQWNMIRRMSGGKKTTRRSAPKKAAKSKAKSSKTVKRSSK
jgi:hypothetical protein